MTESHTAFAEQELSDGDYYRAKQHIAIAQTNAAEAARKSPKAKCNPEVKMVAPPPPKEVVIERVDTDKDGLYDDEDQCPNDPEDKDDFEDADGCPDLDNDKDGIPDLDDQCPLVAEDKDEFEDTDGCPDDDNDKDTVPDLTDECPNTPGQPTGRRPGCPDLVVVTAKEIRITQQIQFDFNKSTIKPVSFPILDAVKDVLVANPKITLEVQGHTDNVGQAAYNMKLSQSRADAVKAYLVGKGIDASRLVSKGYGMTQPLLPNTTEANRGLNRRVQFIRTEASNP
jgi:outer membrane protein OmpA-like peptidoglycan-associated protein